MEVAGVKEERGRGPPSLPEAPSQQLPQRGPCALRISGRPRALPVLGAMQVQYGRW